MGWFRPDGVRSAGPRRPQILGDARNTKMQSVMNLKIKYRESFRPFAPSVLRERVSDYFEMDADSPYMLLVAPVREERRVPRYQRRATDSVGDRSAERAAIRYSGGDSHRLLGAGPDGPRGHEPPLLPAAQGVRAQTGAPCIVNTSFNVRGEPIVCIARRTRTGASCAPRWTSSCWATAVLYKTQQAPVAEDTEWRKEFVLD